MKTMLKSFLLLAALTFLVVSGCDKNNATKKTDEKGDENTKTLQSKKIKKVTIGTGGVTGVYYPTGVAIARILNLKKGESQIEFVAKPTKGSVANINEVMAGKLDFGIVQSDRQYQAVYSEREWAAKGPQEDLRSIFSIHSESITLVASENSNIKTIDDIRGKRINLGTPGSGHFGNALDVLTAMDMKVEDLKPQYFKTALGSEKIQSEEIDAFFYTVGHPNAEIKEASYGRIKIMIIPIVGKKIAKLIEKKPYYTESLISKTHYPNIANKANLISSFGVKATLVTSREVDEEIVYMVAKEIFKNVNELRDFHPALHSLRRGNMLKGLSAPLHRGAQRYYEEKGIIGFIDPSIVR